MDENRVSNTSLQQIDDLIRKLEEYQHNHNFSDFQHSLSTIKLKIELMPYNESKYFVRKLIPLLLRVFEYLITSIETDNVVYGIKVLALDVFSKVVWDNELLDVYQQVLSFLPQILNYEYEDLGIKALKIFLEYYKNMKNPLGWTPVERFLEFSLNIYRNFENIVNENYAIICRENLNLEKIQLKANKSFKVMNEIPFIIMLAYNLFAEQVTNFIQINIQTIASVFKVLKPNPYRNDTDSTKKYQINLYEDYLYTLTKLEYLVAFLLKINDHFYENLFKRFADDIVKAVIHILENTPKDNIHTRKEILSITKNLIKPFAAVFYVHKDYFKNEDNLLGKSVISYDYVFYEVNKIIFTLIDNIHSMMTFDEKAVLLDELTLKINNYKIGYEFKLFIFYYINQILESMRNIPDPALKIKLININNSILRELSYFFNILSIILGQLENFFVCNPSEKTNKYEFLDINFFEDEEGDKINTNQSNTNVGSLSSPSKPDINQIQQTNFHKIYELLLNNEFEKFVNIEETKFIIDLLKHSNALLKICVTLIHQEYSPNIISNVNPLNLGMTPYNPLTVQRQPDPNIISNYTFSVSKKAYFFRKLFRSYINICEMLFKNHSHTSGDEGSAKLYEINLVNIYISLPTNICSIVFQKSMNFIFKAILSNSKACPMKNCLLSIMIDTIFDTSAFNINNDPIQLANRRELYDIFLDFFINKIHYIGNNLKVYTENYQYNAVSMSVLINIFKCLFKYLNFVMEDKTKLKITNFLVSCLILTKSSKFFGNYIYVIRCLFKNLLNIQTQTTHQFEFYKETIHLVYGIMKFMINIKEDFPFLKEMLTEIIMIFPIKFKYMIDYAKIVFPSLIDALNMNQEIIPVGLQYLEQWMNALFHKPENVKPFLQSNINLLTTLLTSHLYKNYAISLNSLKLLSKFGGRSRNYLEDNMINPKTSPTNILVIDLKEITSGKKIEFPIDNIVDLCIKIVTNYKRHSEKNWLNQIKTSFKTLKACFLTFIAEEIDEQYLNDCISNIKKGKSLDSDFETKGYFKKINFSEEQMKINVIYRKAEHFLVEKLLRGLFLCCTITEIEEEIRDFVKFICEYFVLIMITKEKNNKFINVFEIDPTIILDIICEFLFSNNPTVFKNNNQTCISIAMKLINFIIDTIEQIFEKNYDIIKNLEIVDIIFMKLLNACYNNEWSKKGGGIVTLLILIKRFSKDIVFKYLQQIIRAVFLVTNNYSSIVKIKYEGDCEQIISELVSLFITDKKEYEKLSTGMLVEDENMLKANQDFEQMFLSLKYFQEEILNNIHSMSEYSRKIAKNAYQYIMKNKKLKTMSSIFYLIDKLDFATFAKYYNEYDGITIDEIKRNNSALMSSEKDNSNNMLVDQTCNEKSFKQSKSLQRNSNFIRDNPSLLSDPELKLNIKLSYLISNLSNKLELNSSNFHPMLANASALYFILKHNADFVIEYILNNKFEDYLKLLKNLIDILATDMFLYLEITKKIHEIAFNSKFKYFFIEKFYSTKLLYLNLSIKVGDQNVEIENEIPEEYMNDVMKYIFQTHHNHIFEQYNQTNANYTSMDPYLSEIFPILSKKMNMMKNFIRLLKNLVSDKKLTERMKENTDRGVLDRSYNDRFLDLKHKSTNLIFRFIIYREEKVILKASKKYITKLLKVESNTRNLLPEEELKKCIKPVLEQVAQNKLISFKLAESLTILLKLLSSNFNETLGKKLKESIEAYLSSQDSPDNSFVHCIVSLFSYLKPIQIREHVPYIIETLMRIERDTMNKTRTASLFPSKYKQKIIKFLSNFSDYLFNCFMKIQLSDVSMFLFFKRLIRDESSYVIRDTFARNFTSALLPQILRSEPKDYLVNLNFLKIYKILVKKAPSTLNLNENIIRALNDFLEKKTLILYTNPDLLETDRYLDDILKCIVRMNFFFYKSFNKQSDLIFNIFLYRKRTKHTRIKEKIKIFFVRELYSKLPDSRIRNLLFIFVTNYSLYARQNYLSDVLKYVITPLIIHYIREKKSDEYVEKHFVKSVVKCLFNEENKKLYDDSTSLELIKFIIVIIAYFLNPSRDNINMNRDDIQTTLVNIANYLSFKYNSSCHALTLYSCLGLSLVSLLFNKQGEKILNSLNMFFFRQNQYDHLNIINLCFDIIIPFCMSKPEESLVVIKNLKMFMSDRSVNINQFFHIFSLILKYSHLFAAHKINVANIIIQFTLKSVPQHQNSTLQQKKMIIQLFGLIIFWFKNEKLEVGEERSNQIDKLKDNTLILLTKYFRMILAHQTTELEYFEIARRYLLYIRELCKISDFLMKKFLLVSETELGGIKHSLHIYIYLLKIAIAYCKKESILMSLDYIFNLLRQLNLDPSINIRSTNDVILIVRCIINENLFNSINEHKEAVREETKIKADEQILKYIKDFFEHHQSNFNKRKATALPIADFERINNLDIKQSDVIKETLTIVKSKTHNFTHDKLLELFPHFDYRFFVLFYFYLTENGVSQEKYPQNKDVEVILRLSDNLLQQYYENWYVYTIVILQVLKEEETQIKKSIFENPECDYFTSSTNFFANLKTLDFFTKLKNDKTIKITTIEKKTSGIELLMESILIGFYKAFLNKNLITRYKQNVVNAFLMLFEIMQGSSIQSILEELISLAIKCKHFSFSEHNKFIIDLLRIYDFNNKKIPQSLLILVIEYMEAYKEEYDKNCKDILKALLFASRFHDYKVRKRVFRIHDKLNGQSLIEKLKLIFQIDIKQPDVDNNSWLPYSVDFLLHHFQLKQKIIRKEYCAKLKKLNNRRDDNVDMEIDDDDNKGKNIDSGMMIDNEPNSEPKVKFPWIKTYNEEIKKLQTKSLLIPIRDIVLGDISISQKMWFSIFPQVWRILNKDDQEVLAVLLNDFLLFLTNMPNSQKGPLIVKAMLESFANCFPLIKLNPEVLYVLAKNHNSWNSASFYLERMLIANIERERSFTSLNKILETLKEEDHSIGLKRFTSSSYDVNNEHTIMGLSYLQCTNYQKAEEIFVSAFRSYRETTNPSSFDFTEMTSSLTEDFPPKLDFSIWEQGLIDCYRNTNKWNNLLSLGEETNNIEIKIESLWHLGKWQEIESMNVNKYHYLAKINQIYMMMNKDLSRLDTTYQQKCMECIRTIFQDFSTYPPNFEKLNYHYYLIFQMIVEAWESTNTLKEIEKNIQDKKPSDFRENLIMWRDRIPHVCEGFYSLKSILDPRNYLFDILRELIRNNISGGNPAVTANIFPNISDHIWNDMIYLKYARKLNLMDVYMDYNEKFNREIQGLENVYPIEFYMKNMEHFKIFRNINKNYSRGLEIVDELIKPLVMASYNNPYSNTGIENEIKASYLGTKAYFSYKQGKIVEAHECFKDAISLNQTDYQLWKDWAEMSDWTLNSFKDEKIAPVWFDNTLYNYFTMIIFKLDKAKYVIPRIFFLLKKFSNFKMEGKFDKQVDNIPTWVWLFWIPQLFELMKLPNHRDFTTSILKKIGMTYPQNIYYPLNVCLEDQELDSDISRIYEEIKASMLKNDKHYLVLSKIDQIMKELKDKLDRSLEEVILNHLINYIDVQSSRKADDVISKTKYYLDQLKLWNCKLDYLPEIIKEVSYLITQKETTIFDLYEKIKSWRYFIQSKLATESNFKDLGNILNNKLYNMNFDEVEIPGYFVNKIVEPTGENKVYITRFESEYSFKFINFSQKKLLIRGSNEKLFSFSVVGEIYKENSEYKILQLQTILNCIFASNKDTYKSNVKFILPIKYPVTNKLKIVQEETNQYYMNEVFEFCMQKSGFDPEIAYKLYEEEYKKNYSNLSAANYLNQETLQKVFNRMCDLIPAYNLKSFIHKFIINCDEIFIFRKQFATSYAINNFLSYILKFQDNFNLNKISFNKETGSVTLHDMKYPQYDKYNKTGQIIIKQNNVDFRISKNINFFLSPSCLYGVIPGTIHAAANAIIEKQHYASNLIFSTLFYSDSKKVEISAHSSFKLYNDFTEKIMEEINKLNNRNEEHSNHPLRVIMELIENSLKEENLAKMPISWNPWF